LAEYLPVAPVDDEAKKHNENLPGMGGAYNLVNLALYHYAGNNPVKYVDPDGKAPLTSSELVLRNTIFSKILSYVTWPAGPDTQNIPDPRTTSIYPLYFKTGNISPQGISYLKSISSGACTAGAISLRNLYRTRDIAVNGWAIDLKNSNEIKYYKNSSGAIMSDPATLSSLLKVGDVLIYSNPDNPSGVKGGGWTGHTATIIDIDSTYVTTVEWHENGKDPTVQRLRKDQLQWFGDTKLEGAATWE
jgi:hypothetical protein